MDDAASVRGREAVGHLRRDLQGAPERLRAGHLERGALHQLGDDVILADVVDSDDVGMVEGGDRACLLLEARAGRRILKGARHQRLDGHVAAEARISGPIDFAHPSGAE